MKFLIHDLMLDSPAQSNVHSRLVIFGGLLPANHIVLALCQSRRPWSRWTQPPGVLEDQEFPELSFGWL